MLIKQFIKNVVPSTTHLKKNLKCILKDLLCDTVSQMLKNYENKLYNSAYLNILTTLSYVRGFCA